jgi:hypothetical protein
MNDAVILKERSTLFSSNRHTEKGEKPRKKHKYYIFIAPTHWEKMGGEEKKKR